MLDRLVHSLALTIAIVAAIAAIGLAGCRAGRPAPPPVEREEGRFPHARHAELACTECHPAAAVLAGQLARPGADDHAPCDRAACHARAFMARPGPLCQVCHARVAIDGGSASALVAYPPDHGRRALAAEFSHRRHLDAGAMEQAVGFHVGCTDCHVTLQTGAPSPPDHAACGRCHAPEAALAGAPPLDQCRSCHVDRPLDPPRRRRLIVGDLRFSHEAHRADRAGQPIRCLECHVGSTTAERTGDHPLPTIGACVTCHDDDQRTPADRRMRACETCHAGKRASFGAIAPRSHLPAEERPEDHTRAFQRDHAADAERDPTRCARCHTFMSGSPRQACDECHQVMRPEDHVVTWREFDHGPVAATRSDRCAVCHQGDFCVACHAVAPRSHLPLDEFTDRRHATEARLNPRACLTCHDPARDCGGAGCHGARAPGPTR